MHIATCVWQEKAAAMGAAAGGWAGECRVSLVTLLLAAGRALNCVVSFVAFSFLDVLDMVLCLVYKVVDYAVEAEWKPCYCSAAARKDGGGGAGAGAKGQLSFVAPRAAAGAAGPKVVRLLSLAANKMQLEDVSDTLKVRASLLSDATPKPGPIAPALTVTP